MNPHHIFREKCEMAVGDDGHFLENRALDWAKNCHSCASCCYAFHVQISWGSNSWFVRYARFKFIIFASCEWIKKISMHKNVKNHSPKLNMLHVLMQNRSCHLSCEQPFPPNWVFYLPFMKSSELWDFCFLVSALSLSTSNFYIYASWKHILDL